MINKFIKNIVYPTYQDMNLENAIKNKEKREAIVASDAPYICPKCDVAKHPSEFVVQYMKNQLVGNYRWLYECKQCKKKRTASKRFELQNTPTGVIQNIYKQLLQTSRKTKMASDLAEKDIDAIWNKQDGKCYYSNYPMQYNSDKNEFQITLDRKNPLLGYTKINCVLCCSFIQKMKGNMNEIEFLEVCRDIMKHHR